MTADPLLVDQAVRRTLAYFDVFEYPLTAAEVWRWLYRGEGETWIADQGEVQAALDRLIAAQKVAVQDGHHCLPGREQFVAQRAARLVQNEKKWKRAKTVARFVELFPFVKFVGVANTLALNNARLESDIDLLVVTSASRIWLGRMMVTGITELLGYRRHGDKIRDRICLSFYLTREALDLQPLALGPDDHHLAFWATQVVPLMDDQTYELFVKHNQRFTSRLPNAWLADWRTSLLRPRRAFRSIKHSYEAIFGGARSMYFEGWARDYQRQRINKNTTSKAALGTTEVVINEDVLKFHEDDRRARYNQAYRERCQRLGVQP